MIAQGFLFFILMVYKLVHRLMTNDSLAADNDHHQIRADPLLQEAQIRVISKVFKSQPFAILWAVFFFVYLKLPQFCSLFWLTQNQGDIATAFFAIGFLLGT